MSASPAPFLSSSSAASTHADWHSKPSHGPRIHVLPGYRVSVRPAAWPLVVVALLLVVFTVAVPMAINTQMAQRAYEIRDQRVALAEINAQIQTLEAELLVASSPQEIEAAANKIGLVPAGEVGTISLKTKTVEGGEAAQ